MGTSSFFEVRSLEAESVSGGEAVPVSWSVSEVAEEEKAVALVLAAEVAVVARLPLSSVALSVSVEEL